MTVYQELSLIWSCVGMGVTQIQVNSPKHTTRVVHTKTFVFHGCPWMRTRLHAWPRVVTCAHPYIRVAGQ
jgi:hypothetical protein